MDKSTRSTPRAEARGMLRVDTERRFVLRTKVRSLAPSNVSIPNYPCHYLYDFYLYDEPVKYAEGTGFEPVRALFRLKGLAIPRF